MGLKHWATKLYILYRLRQMRRAVNDAREGKPMDFGALIEWVLKLKFFEKYRTKIGLVMGVLGALIPVILSPDMIALVPGLTTAPVWLSSLALYFVGVGARYKDEDPK